MREVVDNGNRYALAAYSTPPGPWSMYNKKKLDREAVGLKIHQY